MTGTKLAARYAGVALICVAASFPGASSPLGSDGAAAARNVIHQLRIYEIFEGNKKAFHERFRDHAMRIMARYGFKIVATWESRSGDRTEFVYLLEWPDRETMKERWARFLADKEWVEIKRTTAAVHGSLVGDVADRTLDLTDYSPHRQLLN